MKKLTVILFSVVVASAFFSAQLPAKERAIKVKLRQSERMNAPVVEEVDLYHGSYALVIGINNYTNGWPILSGAVKDAKLVADVLREKGFDVTFKSDLNSRELKQAFEEFFIFKGENPQARLFVWFAGHGHTIDSEGFVIPADAPRPEAGARFKYKALSLRRFGEFVRLAKSKHALALFDSCFSGTIFDCQRTSPPPAVTRATTLPVRQFLSSGDSNQTVSDDGRFRKLFIRAVNGEEQADANRDGYLTGSELGLFLTDRLTNLTESRQTPRYGKLRDEDWDRGDFVFVLRVKPSPPSRVPPSSDGISDYDKIIQERETNRKKWDSWQSRLENDHAKVERYEKSGSLSAKEKSEAWGSVLASYSADNPYSVKDDELRRQAEERKRYWKDYKESGKLFVETVPINARVRILNIGPRFHQGIELKPGNYHVEVSNQGYETEKIWLRLESGEDKRVEIRLEQLQTSIQATTSHSRPSLPSSSGRYDDAIPQLQKERRPGEALRTKLEQKRREDQQQRLDVASVPQRPSYSRPSPASSNIRTKEHRSALLIGNGSYMHVKGLDTPVNDVREMKKALQDLGFTVFEYENVNQRTMIRSINEFGKKLEGQDVGLFFYAGHAIQVKGHNYLIPVDAKNSESDVEYDCVRADRLLAKMVSAGSSTNIVILDACRHNPFERGTKGGGLAQMNAPRGFLIAFSTSPGATAFDGEKTNSPYTSALLDQIKTPNIKIFEMFQGVRLAVMERSGHRQVPWESVSLMEDFYFASKDA